MAGESDRPDRNQRRQNCATLYGGVGCQIQPDGLDKEHGANDEYHKKAKPLAIPDDLKPGGTHGIYRLTP